MKKIIVNTDGGARGNPGPGAVGVVIKDGEKIYKFSECIGRSTNNEAEYKAVILALEKAAVLFFTDNIELEINVDSELLFKQVLGEYRVKMSHLKPLFEKVKKLSGNFKTVKFNHVRRILNKEADALVNMELDRACG